MLESPRVQAFWNATVEDLFRSYDVDGFQRGAERASPLTNVIQNGNVPTDDPETINQCVMKAYAAGANGIVVSREYKELTVPNLRAVGAAVRELAKTSRG